MPTSPIGQRPDFARVEALDRVRARGVAPDHARNLRLADALLAEARALGMSPPADKLAGIEVDLRVARVLNRLDRV